MMSSLTGFNPRTRVGCDVLFALQAAGRGSFNPRTRVGCDFKLPFDVRIIGKVSIHAPAWGATPVVDAYRGHDAGVSIHAPAWGATLSCRLMSGLSARFQSTHPRGVRLLCAPIVSGASLFQSTHPRGVRLRPWYDFYCRLARFNPRTRVGCDGQIDHAWAINDGFQSTHPRGVRHVFQPGWRDNLGVSIHAPAWGATSARDTFFSARLFQSTHPRGVRHSSWRQQAGHHPVSIHAPAWGATHPAHRGTPAGYVSIHAPAWGATAQDKDGMHFMLGFNPRTRVGCDGSAAGLSLLPRKFQSTHPRGVRPGCSALPVPAPGSFNPRTRVGCDLGQPLDLGSQRPVSIHAPAWGATSAWHGYTPRRPPVSIHAPAWGATATEARQLTMSRVSIHAPAWGATTGSRPPGPDSSRFNPRTRVGCDEPDYNGWLDAHGVSIHAPAWGATGGKRQSSRADKMFQSTHPRGVRPLPALLLIIVVSCFNPRTRVGCDLLLARCLWKR